MPLKIENRPIDPDAIDVKSVYQESPPSNPPDKLRPSLPDQQQPQDQGNQINTDPCSEHCPDEHDIREICQTPPEVSSCDACEWKAYENYLLWGWTQKYWPSQDGTEKSWTTLEDAKSACLSLPENECGGVLKMDDKYFVRKQRNCFTKNKERSPQSKFRDPILRPKNFSKLRKHFEAR